MDDVNAIPARLVEDEPVLEAPDGPAAQASGAGPCETAERPHPGMLGEQVGAVSDAVEEALGDFQSRLLFQVFEHAPDFTPGARPEGGAGHQGVAERRASARLRRCWRSSSHMAGVTSSGSPEFSASSRVC